MVGAKWPTTCDVDLPVDSAWEKVVTLSLKINPELDAVKRATYAMDYGVGRNGVLKVRCREAMRQYVEALLRVRSDETDVKPHLVRV